jgi:hypothetical protein
MSRTKASKNRRRTKNRRVTKKNRTRRNKKIGGRPPTEYAADMGYLKSRIMNDYADSDKRKSLLANLDTMPYEVSYTSEFTGEKLDKFEQGIDRIQNYYKTNTKWW